MPPNSTRVATRGLGRGRTPGGTLLGAAACSGRDPDGVLVYAERVVGRARRPSQRASTVAPTEAAGLEGRDGAGGAGVGRSQRSEKGDCLCIKITLHPAAEGNIHPDDVMAWLIENDGIDFLTKGAESMGKQRLLGRKAIPMAARAVSFYCSPDAAVMFKGQKPSH